MAKGDGLKAVGSFFQQFFTGIGATVGLTQPYNPDAAMYQAQIAEANARIIAAQEAAREKRNTTILYIVGAIVLLAMLGGFGYYAFKK